MHERISEKEALDMVYFCDLIQVIFIGKKLQHQLLKWLLGDFLLFDYDIFVLSDGKLQGDVAKFWREFHIFQKNENFGNNFEISKWQEMKNIINCRYNLSSLGLGLRKRILKY